MDGTKTTLCMSCSCLFLYPAQPDYPKSSLSGTNAKKKASLPNRAVWGQSLPELVPMQSPARLGSFSPPLLSFSSFRRCLGLSDESLPHSLKGSNLFGLFSSLIDVYIY